MTTLALTAASWITLSIITAAAFATVAGAIKRSEPALELLAPADAAPFTGAAAPQPLPVPLPAQRRAGAPVLSA